MRGKFLHVALTILMCAGASQVFADQKIKTKSNIKNDRIQQPASTIECTETCADGERCTQSAADKNASVEVVTGECIADSDSKSSAAAEINQ